MRETQVRSLGWEDPLEESMATTPISLSGELHGQRSLAGYSPWGHKVSDMTENKQHKGTLWETLLINNFQWEILSLPVNLTLLHLDFCVPFSLQATHTHSESLTPTCTPHSGCVLIPRDVE